MWASAQGRALAAASVPRLLYDTRAMGQRFLFLDDDPERHELVQPAYPAGTYCYDAASCIRWLADEWDIVSLDHDLGDELFVDSSRTDCGMEVVRWIVANKPKVGQFWVHSLNGKAAHEMVAQLRAAGYEADRVFYLQIPALLARNDGEA